MTRKVKKTLSGMLAFVLVFSWIFSGYPNVTVNVGTYALQFPSVIQPAFAAITASSTTYSTPGTFTYVVSTNACSQVLDVWGAGGGGGIHNNNGGGGGGGGAFASSTTAFAEDSSHTLVVGGGGPVDSVTRGGNSTVDTTVIVAEGGAGSNNFTGAAGGLASNSTGEITRNGGTGGTGLTTNDTGGGGGGAGGGAGAGENGQDGQTTVGGYGGKANGGTGGEGNGGNGGAGGAGSSASTGGGGGGGGADESAGGAAGLPGAGAGGGEGGASNGANGQITVTEYIDDMGCGGLKAASFVQHAYKWFANTNSVAVGGSSGINAPTITPSQGTPFRLRLLLYNEGGTTITTASATTSDLQFALKNSDGVCDGDESYTNVTSATAIRYYNNSTPIDGDNLTTSSLDPTATSSGVTIRAQDYEESNTFSNTANDIAENEAGLWDFSLVDQDAPPDTTYCFRGMQNDSGTNYVYSGEYDVYPEITTAKPITIRLRGAIVLRTVRLR